MNMELIEVNGMRIVEVSSDSPVITDPGKPWI